MRRFQLDMEEDHFKLLNRIKDRLEAASFAEVMRRALKAYDYILHKPVFIKNDNGEFIPLDIAA